MFPIVGTFIFQKKNHFVRMCMTRSAAGKMHFFFFFTRSQQQQQRLLCSCISAVNLCDVRMCNPSDAATKLSTTNRLSRQKADQTPHLHVYKNQFKRGLSMGTDKSALPLFGTKKKEKEKVVRLPPPPPPKLMTLFRRTK